MEQFIVALVVYSVFAGLTLWRPNLGRIVIGVFFAVMGVVVNGLVLTIAPALFVGMAEEVPWGWYRELMLAVVAPAPQLFGFAMLLVELTIAGLILSRGTARLIGLAGGALFLIGITPLGLYSVANLLLAANLLYLFWLNVSQRPTSNATAGSARSDRRVP